MNTMTIRSLLLLLAGVTLVLSGAWAEPTPWAPNGAVRAIVHADGITYLGGDFTSFNMLPGYGVPLEMATGAPVAVYPQVNGTVEACIPDGVGGWYIGGNFTMVGGVARNRIAHILADGSVDAAWDPNANSTVYALAVSGSTVYAGGQFSTIGGQTRNRIAALSTTTGLATAWNPNASSWVNALAVSGTAVYAGGDFTTIGGQTRNRIAALDTATGLATAWNPNANGLVNALAVSGSTVYVGGTFSTIGGQTRNRIAALSTTTGLATTWNPNATGVMVALAVSGTTVYAGGTFTTIGGQTRNRIAALSASTGLATTWNPDASGSVSDLAVSGSTVYAGGSFTTIGGQARNYIAALDAATGLATAWDPHASSTVRCLAVSGTTVYAGGPFSNIGGTRRNYVAALDAAGTLTDWNPIANNTVSALAVSGTTVYAGGGFTTIGGQTRNRIAAIDAMTGLATSWDPNANDTVNSLAVSGSTVYAGGTFTTIGGQTRNRIATLDASTGLATAWNPNASSTVSALAVSGTTVYVGGAFTTIGGQARNRIAALDAATGLATAWNPNTVGSVYALAVSGSTVYAAGSMLSGYTGETMVVALDAVTGATKPFYLGGDEYSRGYAVTVSDTTVYIGGDFNFYAGGVRNNIAAFDAETGLPGTWDPSANSTVYAVAVSDVGVHVGGNFTTINGDYGPYYAQFSKPALTAPTNPGADSITTDSIRWTWEDQSTEETGFKVWVDPGTADPVTLRTTTAADTTQWTMVTLQANTQYAFQVAAANSSLGDSARTGTITAWTLIEALNSLSFSGVTPTAIHVASPNALSNLVAGASGLYLANTTAGTDNGWQHDMTPWASSGLTPNTQYAFSGKSRNGGGVETSPVSASKYTLAVAPIAGANVTCDKTSGSAYPTGTTFTFTNPAGFGTGTHGGNAYRVSKFAYLWNTSPTYTFSGAESEWSSGTLAQTPASSGSYYLHVQSFNAEDIPGGVLHYGPFMVDVTAPQVLSITPVNPGHWQTPAGPTNDPAIAFTVVFDEAIGTFNGAALTVTGLGVAQLPANTGDLTTWTVTVAGITGNGTLSLTVNSGANVKDLAGNALALSATSSPIVLVDQTPPTVLVGGPSAPHVANTVSFEVTYADAGGSALVSPATLNPGQVLLNTSPGVSGAVSAVTGANPFLVTVSDILGDGTLGISIAAGAAADTAGNLSSLSANSPTCLVKNTAPRVCVSGPNVSSTMTGPVIYSVTYLGAAHVTLGVSDVHLVATGSADADIAVTGGDCDESWLVTLSNVQGDGTLAIRIDAGAALDESGNYDIGYGPSVPVTVGSAPVPATSGAGLVLLICAVGLAGVYGFRRVHTCRRFKTAQDLKSKLPTD